MQIQFRQQLNELLEFYKLPKVIIELGCAEGNFTKDILKWDFDKLYLIDNWSKIDNQTGDGNYNEIWHFNNYNQILEKTAPFKDKVTILKGLSTNMAVNVPDESVGLIFVDACHEYECVKNDIEAYYPKIVQGGILSFHDYKSLSYGVNKAVNEFCEGRFKINLIPDTDEPNSSCWFRKI